MSAVRMDGKALSAKVRGSILAETEELKKQGVTPGLAVIIVGNDPASEIYVRNKERACEQCGFYSEKYARSRIAPILNRMVRFALNSPPPHSVQAAASDQPCP